VNASVLFACALVGALSVPAVAAAPTVSYAPPAGLLPAGHLHGSTYDAVLPSGRFVTPAGTSAVTGVDALGLALSPDGRFAIVGNDDNVSGQALSPIDPGATGGPTLAVFDTATMTPVFHLRAPAGQTFLGGVVAVRDPADPVQTLVLAAGGASDAVYAFVLDGDGHLTADVRETTRRSPTTDAAARPRSRSPPTAGTPTWSMRRAGRSRRSICSPGGSSARRGRSATSPAAPPSPGTGYS